MRLFRTRRADNDIVEIWGHVAADSETAADALLDRIEARIQLLLTFPSIGVQREDVRPGLRMLVMDEYLILYRILGDEIEIVSGVQGRRDLDGLGLPE